MPYRKQPSSRVTIVDVARKSGFSPSTVSIVLNDAPLSRNLAQETREQIKQLAKEMGYRPDAFARSLRSRHSQTIGVMIFDISDPFCMLILRGIETALQPTAYLPIIMDAQNDRQQFERYLEMLLQRRVEGLIVVANWIFEEVGKLVDMQKEKLPLVAVGRDLSEDGISSVIVDNEAGGYAAMEHLYRAGHRRIAAIRGPEKLSDSDRRWDGIQRFAGEQGLRLDARCVRQLPGSLDPISGFEGGRRLTEEMVAAGAKFTAVLAFDDLTCLGVVRGLKAAGLRVPEDCSVIGFDDAPIAAFTTPGLTTIQQPMEQMGALATSSVLKAMRHEEDGERTPLLQLMAPSLVVRESTAKIRR